MYAMAALPHVAMAAHRVEATLCQADHISSRPARRSDAAAALIER